MRLATQLGQGRREQRSWEQKGELGQQGGQLEQQGSRKKKKKMKERGMMEPQREEGGLGKRALGKAQVQRRGLSAGELLGRNVLVEEPQRHKELHKMVATGRELEMGQRGQMKAHSERGLGELTHQGQRGTPWGRLGEHHTSGVFYRREA